MPQVYEIIKQVNDLWTRASKESGKAYKAAASCQAEHMRVQHGTSFENKNAVLRKVRSAITRAEKAKNEARKLADELAHLSEVHNCSEARYWAGVANRDARDADYYHRSSISFLEALMKLE